MRSSAHDNSPLVVLLFVLALFFIIFFFALSGCTESPVAALAVDNVLAAGEKAVFSDQSTGKITTWNWDFGDGVTSTEQNPEHTYAQSGNYQVTLTVANKAGSNSSVVDVSVLEPPAAGISLDGNAFLINDEIKFTDTSTGDINAYLWEFGDGTTSNEKSPVHAFKQKGTFNVSLTVSNELMNDVKTTYIEILEPPVAEFTVSDNVVAANDEIIFTNTSTGDIDSYFWDFGDGSTSTEENPTHKYLRRKRDYTATLTVSNVLGQDTAICEILVLMPTTPDFRASPWRTVVGAPVEFTDISPWTFDVDSWLWDFGDGSTSEEENPSHIYEKGGIYTIKLTLENALGTNTMVKEDLITITTIDVSLIHMCSQIDEDGRQVVHADNTFYTGNPILVYFQVRGFEKIEVKQGFELWVDLTRFAVVDPNGETLIEQTNLASYHGIVPENDALLYLWFGVPVGVAEKDDPIGKYDVYIEVTDRLRGDTYLALAYFKFAGDYS